MGADMPERDKPRGLVMSMGQKVVVGVMTAMLVSMCGLVLDTRAQLSSLRGDMRVIENEIRHLRESIENGMDDRYRASTAASDFKVRDERTSALKRRVEVVEESVEEHHKLGGHDVMDRRMSALEERVKALEGR